VSRHLVTTDIELATCNRCKAYVFTSLVGGLRVSVDPAPLSTPESYREALLGGRATYRLSERSGRPYRLERETPGVERSGVVVAAHGCGCAGQDATGVEVVPLDPLQAPVTRGRLPDGYLPPPAPERRSQGHTGPFPVVPARDHLSERVRRSMRCAVCDRVVTCHDAAISLEFPEPYTRLEKVKAKDGMPAYSREVRELGTKFWAVHEECM
jgi:hypothetical protein